MLLQRSRKAPVLPRKLRLEALEDRRVPAGLGLLSAVKPGPGLMGGTAALGDHGAADNANSHADHAAKADHDGPSLKIDIAVFSLPFSSMQTPSLLIEVTFNSFANPSTATQTVSNQSDQSSHSSSPDAKADI